MLKNSKNNPIYEQKKIRFMNRHIDNGDEVD